MKKFFTLIAVAGLAFAAQANELTIGEGLSYVSTSPICGLMADTEGTMSQTIYPASMLSEMQGGKITGVTFYTLADYYGGYDPDEEDYINFEDATIQLAFLETDEMGFTEVVAKVGATPVATTVPEFGEMTMSFVLDEPFEYTGKNLLVECKVIEAGSWGMTYFFGSSVETYNSTYYWYDDEDFEYHHGINSFLPKTTFTYEEGQAPLEQTAAPSIAADTQMGVHAYFVTITPSEESDIYYRYRMENGEWGAWTLYDGTIPFKEDGYYEVEAYAIANGKSESLHVSVSFIVTPRTGLDELSGDKAVSSVRFFNVAGQEMQQAQGLTIVVTTYTDGTTSTVKVMK